MRCFLISAILFASDPVWAQSKFFSTPSRAGVEGAKQNTILTVLQNEQQRMNTCTASGMIYGPTHPQATASGCIPGLVMQEQGHAWFSGNLGIGAPAIDAGGVRLYVRDTTPNTNTVIAIDNSGVPGGYDAQLILKNSLRQWGVVAAGAPDHADAAGAFGVLDQTANAFRLIIDSKGNLGIGTNAPTTRLDVSGAIKIGNAVSCASETEGSLRYNEMVKRMEFCNGTEWGAMGGGGAVCQAGKTLNICRRYRRYSPTSGWYDTGYGCSPIDGGYLVSNIGDDTGWKNQTLEIALRCQ